MKNKKWILPTLLCLVPILGYLAFYNQLPDQIPMHFNVEGVADGFMPKSTATYLPSLFMVGVQLVCVFAMNTDPKRENYARQLKDLCLWICPVLSILLNGMILMISLGKEIRIELVTPLMIGVLFVVIGNYMPKVKQNYTMGIKIPWTLNSVDNWNKTHRFAGFVFVLMGLWMIVASILKLNFVLAVIPALACVILPVVYSYLLYCKENGGNEK